MDGTRHAGRSPQMP